MLPSVAHYLILDPERRTVICHKRGQGEVIETRILTSGPLRLDPPGLELAVDELFPPAETPLPTGEGQGKGTKRGFFWPRTPRPRK